MLPFYWKFFRKNLVYSNVPTFHPAVVTLRHVSPSAHWSRMRGWYCYPLLSHRKIHAPQRLFECYRRGRKSCAAKSIDHCEPWDIGFSVTSQNMTQSIVGTCLHWQMSAWTVWCDEYQLKKRHVLLLPVPALQSTSVLSQFLIKIHDSKLVRDFWDLGAYMRVHAYAIEVKWNLSPNFLGPKLITKHRIQIQICHRINNQVKH